VEDNRCSGLQAFHDLCPFVIHPSDPDGHQLRPAILHDEDRPLALVAEQGADRNLTELEQLVDRPPDRPP
tara:strand:+ start:168 stop:377 length:210 start_codon:yes stop_codon:yes gene_type:complete